MSEFTPEIIQGLAAGFPEDEVEFLPRAHSNGKALGLPYIDARGVMRRLDAVVGPAGWSFDFDVVSGDGKMVRGRLTVLGVTKCDAGEASTEDEILKSAVSDALKRCAVHFGVGRYLYYLPRVWAAYDAQKRRFTEQPRIEPAAIRRALALCGVGGPVPAVGKKVEVPPAELDRPPVTLPAVQRAERGPLMPNGSPREQVTAPVVEGESQCPKCFAPAGKPHLRKCPTLAAATDEPAGNAYSRGA